MVKDIVLENILNVQDYLKRDYLEFFDLNSEEENTFFRWLLYKEGRYPVDLDTSIVAVVGYWMLLSVYDKNNLKQFESIKKYSRNQFEFIVPDVTDQMRGDWMTSPMHIIKTYMGLLWQQQKNNKYTHYAEFCELFDEITSHGMLKSKEGSWLQYCEKNAYIIWDAFHDEAKKFVKSCLMSGNFISMPIYVNPSRCKFDDDTADTLLWKIYCYYCLKKEDRRKYLNSALLGRDAISARENFKNWLNYFKTWNIFVEYNQLHSFVSKVECNFGSPICLKTGKKIDLDIGDVYNPKPQNIDECIVFFRNYNKAIENRTSAIIDVIQENKKEMFGVR